MSLRRNIEYKARLTDFDLARRTAAGIATDHLSVERQTDTYFAVPHGRLKLREIAGCGAWLVGYQRENHASARGSDYRLIEVADPIELKAALSTALGVRVVVRKRREIHLFQNVRIHLDKVEKLGDFLEFEAVLGDEDDDATGQALLAALTAQFRGALGDPVASGYADLLLQAQSAPNANR